MEIIRTIYDGKGPACNVLGAEKLDVLLSRNHHGKLIYSDKGTEKDIFIWVFPNELSLRASYLQGSPNPVLGLIGLPGSEKNFGDLEKTLKQFISNECGRESL